MSEKDFYISIPLDEDGFIEMECDYCKTRFMLHKEVFEDEQNLNFFCPICGIPNSINKFLVPEVIEKAKQIMENYVLDELEKDLSRSIRKINKSGVLKMSVKKTKRIRERELYTPIENYVMCLKQCCSIVVKVKNIDKETGTYCPICGCEE